MEDSRAVNLGGAGWRTYSFTYNDVVVGSINYGPHLIAIADYVASGESYSLSYYVVPGLTSPFNDGASYGNTLVLNQVVQQGTGLTHTFNYSAAAQGAELAQVVSPEGAYFRYDYSSFTDSAGRTIREVSNVGREVQ